MTKQPVVGTIIIGILVALQGLWALALALDLSLLRSIDPTHILVGTLLGLALILIIVALWPRSTHKRETVRFSPVSAEQARSGITAKKEDVEADLRWIDHPTPIAVPIVTQATATVLVNPTGLAIRTSSPDVDIDPSLGVTSAGQQGIQNVYLGPGLTDPSQARLTVDVAATALTVRSH